MDDSPHYYVVLIGCDLYPPEQSSLYGCVHDIDAIEGLLFNPPGIGIPLSHIHLTRLAAPHADAPSASRFVEQTQPPTRDTIIAALQSLARPELRPQDRVLIYYSGHGGQLQREQKQGWYECIVASDNQLIFDDELNALIGAITVYTSDVTVVLDCCHAAGATRDAVSEPTHGATRYARIAPSTRQRPDPALVGSAPLGRRSGAHMLQSSNPTYVAIAACQADEKAQEDLIDGVAPNGFLTYSLVSIVSQLDGTQRANVRWSDIWPRLLDVISQAAANTGRTSQHPWLIGHPERYLFGGDWTPHDPGFQIRTNPDGTFTIEAGTLVGFSVDALVGVYGPTPERFHPIGSEADRNDQIGTVRITSAQRARCSAIAVNQPPNPLPDGVRARMIAPGTQERLRIWIDPADPDPSAVIAQSDLLQVVAETAEAEVSVERTEHGWSISNDTNRALAELPLRLANDSATHKPTIRAAHERLRNGLVSYAAYQRVLRLAKQCTDPQLDQTLIVRLLDCSNKTLVEQTDPKRPALPELSRNADQLYEAVTDQAFCIRLENMHYETVYVTVFNCTAGGKVEYLGETSIKYDDVETIWFDGIHRHPIYAVPDNPMVDSIDRIVAVATTRKGVNLRGLEVAQTVQELFDSRDRGTRKAPVLQAERWTATIQPLKLLKA